MLCFLSLCFVLLSGGNAHAVNLASPERRDVARKVDGEVARAARAADE